MSDMTEHSDFLLPAVILTPALTYHLWIESSKKNIHEINDQL